MNGWMGVCVGGWCWVDGWSWVNGMMGGINDLEERWRYRDEAEREESVGKER